MRDTIIIGVACLIAIAVGAWLFLFGDTALTKKGPVGVTVVAEGHYSGSVTERTNYRIRSQEELAELWAMVYGADMPPLPQVDFSQKEVLAVFDGTHSSGGYDVRVESVTDTDVARTVSLVRVVPEEGCATIDALTSPFVMVAAARSALPLTREEATETGACE
jgi:hypothetical protein